MVAEGGQVFHSTRAIFVFRFLSPWERLGEGDPLLGSCFSFVS